MHLGRNPIIQLVSSGLRLEPGWGEMPANLQEEGRSAGPGSCPLGSYRPGGEPCLPPILSSGHKALVLEQKLLALVLCGALPQQSTFGPLLSLSIFKKRGFGHPGEPIINMALETINFPPRHG